MTKPSLVEVARVQRFLLLCILGQLVVMALFLTHVVALTAAIYLIGTLVLQVVSLIFAVWLALRLFGPSGALVCAAVLLAPIVAAFVLRGSAELFSLLALGALLVVNGAATRALKASGIRVGLMGADPREVAAKAPPP